MTEDEALERYQEQAKIMGLSAQESDRGITLIIAAHIDACLRRILEAVLLPGKATEEFFDATYAPLGSLSGKTKAAFVMGLITRQERDRIDAVRAVRNVFAHEADASFEHPDIRKICARPVVGRGAMTLRDEFLHMAQNTVLPLLYRDLQIAGWRRAELTQADVNAWHRAQILP